MPAPALAGVHHLKFPCKSIAATHDFYVNVMGFVAMPYLTHYRADKTAYAMIIELPAQAGTKATLVEINDNPDQATAQKGWNPVTWLVGTKQDLEDWLQWWDKHKVKHSKIFRGVVGWVAVAEDPDGRRVRLYTEEQHEWEENPDRDGEWLDNLSN